MIGLDDIHAAALAIGGRIHRTPLLSSRTLSELCACRVFVKAENLQKTGSFKVRGVFNRIAALTDQERERGLIGFSSGNHAQAMAYAAAVEGVACTVVMPARASVNKANAARDYGAEVILHGDENGAFAHMEMLRAARGLTLVHPFDDPHVIAGQGTIGLEILDDLDAVDVVILPIGGGGLAAGVAAAIKALRPATRVVGVEPSGAAAMTAALAAGRPVRLERVDTFADGLTAPFAGALTLEHVRALVDDVVVIEDDTIRAAVRLMLERGKLLLEGAGAASIAALMARAVTVDMNDQVVCVASGGNLDLGRLGALL